MAPNRRSGPSSSNNNENPDVATVIAQQLQAIITQVANNITMLIKYKNGGGNAEMTWTTMDALFKTFQSSNPKKYDGTGGAKALTNTRWNRENAENIRYHAILDPRLNRAHRGQVGNLKFVFERAAEITEVTMEIKLEEELHREMEKQWKRSQDLKFPSIVEAPEIGSVPHKAGDSMSMRSGRIPWRMYGYLGYKGKRAVTAIHQSIEECK
ncbi:hypothetical protein Tco_0287490 [Tanacetum coccineum]